MGWSKFASLSAVRCMTNCCAFENCPVVAVFLTVGTLNGARHASSISLNAAVTFWMYVIRVFMSASFASRRFPAHSPCFFRSGSSCAYDSMRSGNASIALPISAIHCQHVRSACVSVFGWCSLNVARTCWRERGAGSGGSISSRFRCEVAYESSTRRMIHSQISDGMPRRRSIRLYICLHVRSPLSRSSKA